VKGNVYQEVERTVDDESNCGKYASKFSKDYLDYRMNSIVSEEKEMRLTTYDLAVLDNYFNSALKGKRYGFLPLTIHSRDSPNSNPHYLLIILDYKSGRVDSKTGKIVVPDKFYLFDSRNSNDYLFRSKYLPSSALDQLMFGLTQYKPFSEFEYVPTEAWLGKQLQTVVHQNKWDSIYSLAWCLLVAMWLDSSEEVTPETLMVELNNSELELDKQNFIHEFARSVLTEFKDHVLFGKSVLPNTIEHRGASYCRSMTTNAVCADSVRVMTEEEHKVVRPAMYKKEEVKTRRPELHRNNETLSTPRQSNVELSTPRPDSPPAETDPLVKQPNKSNCTVM